MKNKITVIGCGVIGLSTAILLQKEGYEVSIISENLPPNTTSNKAAAIWFPFIAEPKEKVVLWSKVTYWVFEKLAESPETGVTMVDFLKLGDNPEAGLPWWTEAMPENTYRLANQAELPKGFSEGFMLYVPMIETPIYMAYLLHNFLEAGGEIIQKKVTDLKEVLADEHITINCTGLGSRELLNDTAMIPIQGHIVQVQTKEKIPYLDFDTEKELAYIFPRKDCCILGGTAKAGIESIEVEKETVEAIFQKCTTIEPKLKDAVFLNAYVGIRPGRKEIRLEKDKNLALIHNYGHGGSGFTVSWACAEEVKNIVEQISY